MLTKCHVSGQPEAVPHMFVKKDAPAPTVEPLTLPPRGRKVAVVQSCCPHAVEENAAARRSRQSRWVWRVIGRPPNGVVRAPMLVSEPLGVRSRAMHRVNLRDIAAGESIYQVPANTTIFLHSVGSWPM